MRFQAKYILMLRHSFMLVVLLLICTPCFVKQSIKQYWGLPVAEGKVSHYSLQGCSTTLERVEESKSIIQQLQSNYSAKYFINFTSFKSLVFSCLFITYKSRAPAKLYLLYRQFRN